MNNVGQPHDVCVMSEGRQAPVPGEAQLIGLTRAVVIPAGSLPILPDTIPRG